MTELQRVERLDKARALAAANQPEAAIRLYQASLAEAPDDVQTGVLLGVLLASQARFAEAAAAFEALLAVQPDHEEAHLMLAEVYARQGQADRAEQQLARLVQQQPAQSRGWLNLGALQGRRGRVSEAIQALERAIELEPRRLETLFWLADARLKTGQTEAAVELFRQVLKRHPGHLEARTGLGAALYQRGEVMAAVRELQRVLQDDPNREEAVLLCGEALRDLGDLDGAERLARRASGADAAYLLGSVLHRRGRLEEAEQVLLQAPPSPDLHAELGRLYATMERWEPAVEHLQAAVRLCPTSCQAHYNLGLALQESGRPRLGLLALKRAAELDATYAEPWFAMGYASETAGHMGEARAQYEQYLRLAKANPLTARLRKRLGSFSGLRPPARADGAQTGEPQSPC